MEEIENDKMIYWFIFFAVLVAIAVWAHHYVFSYANQKENENKQEMLVEEVDVDDYLGVWQLFGDDDLPLQELLINVIDGSTITFDYFVNEVAYFESQTASLEEGTATFNIVDRDGLGMVKGKFTFKNDKVYFIVTLSDIDGIYSGTYQFIDRGEESLLN